MNKNQTESKPEGVEDPREEGLDCVSSGDRLPMPRRQSKSVMGLLAMTSMLAACGMYGMGGGGRSSYAERHDLDRPKNPEDMERMAAAQRKRDRKAARRFYNSAL
jgi:hypothetical protein